jgi:hypothetical protein
MRLVRTLGLLLFAAIAGVSEAAAQLVSITIAPPVLPVYVQPAIPGPGYIWTPGYWAYGDAGYYWVPGTWVLPPAVGVLWTPGYWGWHDGIYGWNAGYWGPRRRQLRIWLHRRGLCRRLLARRRVQLQPNGQQFRQRQHHKRL